MSPCGQIMDAYLALPMVLPLATHLDRSKALHLVPLLVHELDAPMATSLDYLVLPLAPP